MLNSLMHTTKTKSPYSCLLVFGITNGTTHQSNTDNFVNSFHFRHFAFSVPKMEEHTLRFYHAGQLLPEETSTGQAHRGCPELHSIHWHYLETWSKYRVRQPLQAQRALHQLR